ncbi:hypothetical protein RIVM261_069040 [Rivularia sp. IAM M-261]|nr:hypothetical protein RIVM261_069040 [Rivularia sp. IAM M-261]
MDLEMVLNELSLLTPAADIPSARRLMSELISTLRQATTSGVNRVLRTQNDINIIEIAPNYPIASWRNDNEVSREERSYFRTLTAKAPVWVDAIEDIKNNFDLSDVYYQEMQAIGLGFALVSNCIAVSLLSNDCWDASYLQVKFSYMDEDGDIISESVDIIHASRRQHIQNHINWIQERIRRAIYNGLELWDRREEFFPNLDFCDSVARQLQSILNGQLELQAVVDTLFTIQECCSTWQTGAFSLKNYSLDESGESESTLNQYARERTFTCPDGQRRLFERHVKLRFCNWRIHFFAEKPGKVIIGYVGRHLPTVKYRT